MEKETEEDEEMEGDREEEEDEKRGKRPLFISLVFDELS